MAIRYIFCINTGRSGSGYLYELFNCASDIAATHEPEPICNRKPMIDFLKGRQKPMKSLMPDKLKSIKKILSKKKLYFESNHAFIKGFGWLLPEYIPEEKIGVVILKRPPIQIAKSFHRIGCNSINHNGRGWLIHASDHNLLAPLPFGTFKTKLYYWFYRFIFSIHHAIKVRPNLIRRISFDLIAPIPFDREFLPPESFDLKLLSWYAEEVYARAERYKVRFPRITYFELELHELNNSSKVEQLFNAFGVNYDKRKLEAIVGKKVNQKLSFK